MPRWTEAEFAEWCRKKDRQNPDFDPKTYKGTLKGYDIGLKYEDHFNTQLQSSEPEPAVCHEPLGQNQGKEAGAGRIGISITGFRTRLLDPDNFAGGCKYAVDALRYANLIPGDRHDQIELTFRQVKVKTKPEERTIIELDLP